mgnify:CR=1 FL=1|jgi:hypothetical protein
MSCPVHPLQKVVGYCEVCRQEVCALCLASVATPMDLECSGCGNLGTVFLLETLRSVGAE